MVEKAPRVSTAAKAKRRTSVLQKITGTAPPAPPPEPEVDPLSNPQIGVELRAVEAKGKKLNIIPWDKVKIEKVIASGAFGRVSKGSYNFTNVAIKQLLPGGSIAELFEEVETMKALVHPNLLAPMGLASDRECQLGLVMEFMPTTMFALLHDSKFRKAYPGWLNWMGSYLALVTDVAKGMDYLHYVGMVHRDLKPQNVLVSDQWVAKVADFGEVQRKADPRKSPEAKKIVAENEKKRKSSGGGGGCCSGGGGNDVDEAATATGDAPPAEAPAAAEEEPEGDHKIHGSAPYLSPEAASAGTANEKPTGTPADVWGFGCVLAHVACLSPPYIGRVSSVMDVINQLRDGTADPLASLTEEKAGSPALFALAKSCCLWEASERPTFLKIVEQLTSSNLVQEVCREYARLVDEDDDGNPIFEACRPTTRLSPNPKPPRRSVFGALATGEGSEGKVSAVRKSVRRLSTMAAGVAGGGRRSSVKKAASGLPTPPANLAALAA